MKVGEYKNKAQDSFGLTLPLEYYIKIPVFDEKPVPYHEKTYFIKMAGLKANTERYTVKDVELHFRGMIEDWQEETEGTGLEYSQLNDRVVALNIMLNEKMYHLLRDRCLYEAEQDASLATYEMIDAGEREQAKENAQDWLDRAAALEKEIEKDK